MLGMLGIAYMHAGSAISPTRSTLSSHRFAPLHTQAQDRLASDEEVAPLLQLAAAAAMPSDPDAGLEFGRGRRLRSKEE